MKQLKNFSTKSQNLEQELSAAKQKFGNMDEDALYLELKKRVAESKADGSFSKGQMEGYIAKISPYLTERQRQKLSELVKQLY